ncbi:hypothetical protein FRX31_019036 [Thalictrum thalictroides]|uniref:Uncharacterized protein n=1 Tax=Thalictrum thalictroides TaxID=46969 RepID=A0A7J6W4X0_THATH|nr:hypothetical protein FRX31_019036 [Thalictrum thalictroides]
MAKSQRSKREKRLRTIRREITTPYYDKQESAKLAAQEAALAAPKIPPKIYSNNKSTSMEITSSASAATNTITNTMDIDMNEGGTSYDQKSGSLKPIGRKLKKKLKIGKGKRGKGKIRRKSV